MGSFITTTKHIFFNWGTKDHLFLSITTQLICKRLYYNLDDLINKNLMLKRYRTYSTIGLILEDSLRQYYDIKIAKRGIKRREGGVETEAAQPPIILSCSCHTLAGEA